VRSVHNILKQLDSYNSHNSVSVLNISPNSPLDTCPTAPTAETPTQRLPISRGRRLDPTQTASCRPIPRPSPPINTNRVSACSCFRRLLPPILMPQRAERQGGEHDRFVGVVVSGFVEAGDLAVAQYGQIRVGAGTGV
jgi:hypothetical protein